MSNGSWFKGSAIRWATGLLSLNCHNLPPSNPLLASHADLPHMLAPKTASLTWLVALLSIASMGVGVAWPDLGAWLATENGPVESLSVMVWFTVAACLLFMHRPTPGAALALAVVCAILAIREHGIPPEVVPSGKALMRLSHYFDPQINGLRRLAEGAAVLGIMVSLCVSCWHLFRFMLLKQGWRTPTGRLLTGAFVVLAASQVLERWLGEDAMLYEEVLECATALLVLASVRALHLRQPDSAVEKERLPAPVSRAS